MQPEVWYQQSYVLINQNSRVPRLQEMPLDELYQSSSFAHDFRSGRVKEQPHRKANVRIHLPRSMTALRKAEPDNSERERHRSAAELQAAQREAAKLLARAEAEQSLAEQGTQHGLAVHRETKANPRWQVLGIRILELAALPG